MKQTVATVIVLLTMCAGGVGQEKPSQAQSQAPVNAGEKSSQAISSSEGVPRFRAEARQVLLGATVFKLVADKRKPDESLLPRQALKRYPLSFVTAITQYANRLDGTLAPSDFHVFDDGTEQRINYFKKSVLPIGDWSGIWFSLPTPLGTWGFPPPDVARVFNPPILKYLIGYVPPTLEPGKCHEVRVAVEGREIVLDRSSYCTAGSDDLDEATREETAVGRRMRSFAESEKKGAIKVSAKAYAFWSSRVLSLVNQSLAIGSAAPLASDLTYVVKVHDSKAPSTVHIAVQFKPPWEHWDASCAEKEALHVLGIAYSENHQIAGQFGVTYACGDESQWHYMREKYIAKSWASFNIPTRFDTQMELAPGDYHLRVVVSDGKKRFGIARVPVHVDRFDGQQLAMSDVVLSSVPRDASKVLDEAAIASPSPLVPTPLVNKNNQFVPDIETHIRQHSQFPLYFEIYEPLLKEQTTEVYMHVRVTEQKTGFILLDPGLISAADWMLPGNPVIPVGFSLNIHKLEAGDYQVEVQASDSAGRKSEWRKAKFTIYE
jgi:hypothetical protein